MLNQHKYFRIYLIFNFYKIISELKKIHFHAYKWLTEIRFLKMMLLKSINSKNDYGEFYGIIVYFRQFIKMNPL